MSSTTQPQKSSPSSADPTTTPQESKDKKDKKDKKDPDHDDSDKPHKAQMMTPEELEEMRRRVEEEVWSTSHEEMVRRYPWLKAVEGKSVLLEEVPPEFWDEI